MRLGPAATSLLAVTAVVNASVGAVAWAQTTSPLPSPAPTSGDAAPGSPPPGYSAPGYPPPGSPPPYPAQPYVLSPTGLMLTPQQRAFQLDLEIAHKQQERDKITLWLPISLMGAGCAMLVVAAVIAASTPSVNYQYNCGPQMNQACTSSADAAFVAAGLGVALGVVGGLVLIHKVRTKSRLGREIDEHRVERDRLLNPRFGIVPAPHGGLMLGAVF